MARSATPGIQRVISWLAASEFVIVSWGVGVGKKQGTPDGEADKRPYETPKLIPLGTVEDIVQTIGGGGDPRLGTLLS